MTSSDKVLASDRSNITTLLIILPLFFYRTKPSRPSLARIILSLESNAAKQQALQHILNALQILR